MSKLILILSTFLVVQPTKLTGLPHDMSSGSLIMGRTCDHNHFEYNSFIKFYTECEATPCKDPKASLPDSYWHLLECLISKSLSETKEPFTLLNFAKAMTTNLTDKSRSAILNEVKNDTSKTMTSLDDLKLMWTKYFEAEYKVCQHEDEADKAAPIMICQNMTYPALPYETLRSNETCLNSLLNYKFPNMTSGEIVRLMNPVCDLIVEDIIKEKDLKTELNFEKLIPTILPRFWSSQVKETAMKQMPQIMAPDVTLDGVKVEKQTFENFNQVFSALKKMIKTKIDTWLGDKETDEFYINIYTLNHIIMATELVEDLVCQHF